MGCLVVQSKRSPRDARCIRGHGQALRRGGSATARHQTEPPWSNDRRRLVHVDIPTKRETYERVLLELDGKEKFTVEYRELGAVRKYILRREGEELGAWLLDSKGNVSLVLTTIIAGMPKDTPSQRTRHL